MFLPVTPDSKRIRKWAGVVWAYDPRRRTYRRVTHVTMRKGFVAWAKRLWRRIRLEEDR